MRISIKHVVSIAGLGILAACGSPESSDDDASSGARSSASVAASKDSVDPTATDTMDGTTIAEYSGDAAKGEKVFLQCKSCHAVEPGQNGIGPSLAGIIGSEAGKVEGFNYTPANRDSGITWSSEKMFQYLENPQRIIPGTKMAFAGLRDPQDRADLIAYLQGASE